MKKEAIKKVLSKRDDFDFYLNFNFKLLWYLGIVIKLKDEKGKIRNRNLERIPMLATITAGLAAGLSQTLWILDSLYSDIRLAILISSNFLCTLCALAKCFKLATGVQEFEMLFRELKILWDQNRPTEECREKILKGAAQTLFFCKSCGIFFTILVASWGFPSFQNLLSQYLSREETNHTYDFSKRIFMLRYPFEINTMTTYILVLIEEQWLLFGLALSWGGCDGLFAQLTSHVCLQLEILKHDVKHLIDAEDDENCLKQNIIIFATRHRNLLRIAEYIENLFGSVLFTTTLVSSLNLCVNVFELREEIQTSRFADARVHVLLLVSILYQIAIYCTYAELLTQKTSSVADAIYNCKWTEKHYKFRVYFQILILKCQQPFYYTAYGFFRVGHIQLTKIANGSLSFYMCLQATH